VVPEEGKRDWDSNTISPDYKSSFIATSHFLTQDFPETGSGFVLKILNFATFLDVVNIPDKSRSGAASCKRGYNTETQFITCLNANCNDRVAAAKTTACSATSKLYILIGKMEITYL
jgi:hypothetical protein